MSGEGNAPSGRTAFLLEHLVLPLIVGLVGGFAGFWIAQQSEAQHKLIVDAGRAEEAIETDETDSWYMHTVVVKNAGGFPEEDVEVAIGLAGNPGLKMDGPTIWAEPDILLDKIDTWPQRQNDGYIDYRATIDRLNLQEGFQIDLRLNQHASMTVDARSDSVSDSDIVAP